MRSYRVLGVIALGAIVLAVISFTVVDVTIDGANGCLAARVVCREHTVPSVAIGFAIAGVLALLAAIPPAIGWVLGMLHRAEVAEPLPRRARRPAVEEDF